MSEDKILNEIRLPHAVSNRVDALQKFEQSRVILNTNVNNGSIPPLSESSANSVFVFNKSDAGLALNFAYTYGERIAPTPTATPTQMAVYLPPESGVNLTFTGKVPTLFYAFVDPSNSVRSYADSESYSNGLIILYYTSF